LRLEHFSPQMKKKLAGVKVCMKSCPSLHRPIQYILYNKDPPVNSECSAIGYSIHVDFSQDVGLLMSFTKL